MAAITTVFHCQSPFQDSDALNISRTIFSSVWSRLVITLQYLAHSGQIIVLPPLFQMREVSTKLSCRTRFRFPHREQEISNCFIVFPCPFLVFVFQIINTLTTAITVTKRITIIMADIIRNIKNTTAMTDNLLS